MSIELTREIAQALHKVADCLHVLDEQHEWTFSQHPQYDHWLMLNRKGSDESIWISLESRNWRGPVERFEFRGHTPEELKNHEPYNHQSVKASVSASRSPEAIAKEIARRILPEYRKQLAEMREHKAASDDYNDRQRRLMRRMAAAFRTNAPKDDEREVTLFNGHRTNYQNKRRGYTTNITTKGYIQQDGYEQVDLNFEHITPELAEELLKVAARHASLH